MYSYDEANQVLRIFRKDLKENFPCSLVEPVLASYKQYRTTTVKEDLQVLIDSMSKEFNADIRISNIVVKLSDEDMLNNAIPEDKRHYTVYADLTTNGVLRPKVEVFRIPYMDDNGLYGGKVIVHELLRLEELSYDEHKKLLTLVMPDRVLPIAEENEGFKWIGYGKSKLHVYYMLLTLLVEQGVCTEENVKEYLVNIFKSPQMRRYTNKFFAKLPATMIDVSDRFAADDKILLNRLTSDVYHLGRSRSSINMHFSLDKALGHILAEDVVLPKSGFTISAGTLIDEKILKSLKRGYVSRVVVDFLPTILGRELTEEVTIAEIRCGTEVTEYLADRVPSLSKYRYVSETIDRPLTIPAGTKLQMDHLKLMHSNGITQVYTKDGPVPYLFKHEIISNNTIAITDLYSDGAIPQDCIYKHTDSLYIPAVQQFSHCLDKAICSESLRSLFMPDKLNIDDVQALIGYAIGIVNMPDTFHVYSRDEDFVKKIYTVNDTLSAAFRRKITHFLRTNRVPIDGFIHMRSSESEYVFRRMVDLVRQDLYERSILRPADHTNPLALITSTRQIATVAKNASITQRSIVMGHFGRLDPYETPAGKKIGLNTTMPVHCRVRDGQIETAYHPVERSGGKAYVSPRVEWLTQLEEFGKRFGDIMSIQTTGDLFNSPIIPTKVVARVPATASSDEKITADMALSTDLDYVTTSGDQTLGVTAMMIPFLGADDGVRVSYALSMMKQALYLPNSEVPLVMTSMYSKLYREGSGFVVRAPYDGQVDDVLSNLIYTKEDPENPIYVKEVSVRGKSLTTLDYRVKPGDTFKKGDILADSTMSREGYFTPGVNLMVGFMPFFGFNNEDALPVSTRAVKKATSFDVSTISKEFSVTPNERPQLLKSEKRFIKEGDPVFFVQRTSSRFHTDRDPIQVEAPVGKSGILYNVGREADNFSVTYSATLVNFAQLREGDKMAGRHGNKSTVSRVFSSAEFPMFRNGVVLDVCQNPCGLPSRMNIGQQLEAHLGFVAYMLGIRCESDGFNGASSSEIRELWEFVYDCANCDNFGSVLNKWKSCLPAPLLKQAMQRLSFMQEWKGCFFPNGKAQLINQKTGKPFAYPIAFGMGYYLKLFHQVDHKMHVRGGVVGCDYTQLEKQPPRGSSKGGGQRVGEMEGDILNAYGAHELVREMLNEKSDNVDMRERLIPLLTDPSANASDINYDMRGTAPRVSETLRYDLEALGIDMSYDDGYDLSMKSVMKRKRLRVQKMPTIVEQAPTLPPEVLEDLARFADDE